MKGLGTPEYGWVWGEFLREHAKYKGMCIHKSCTHAASSMILSPRVSFRKVFSSVGNKVHKPIPDMLRE